MNITKRVEIESIRNFNDYTWHPLYLIVMQVKSDYFRNVNELYENNWINNEKYGVLMTDYDFKSWLNFLNTKIYNDYIYNDIFDKLIINQYGNLVLFKYKNYIDLSALGCTDASFFELYNGLFLECRSVVIDIKYDTIALASMKKFKNYGEESDNKTWSINNIKDKIKKSYKIEITNKMDGSYQQYRWYNNKVIGSGSQALDYKESWRLEKGFKLLGDNNKNYIQMLKDFPDYTFMFEFVSPDNPIVVKYSKEEEGLYLFNARNNHDGTEIELNLLEELAKNYNVPMVKWYKEETFENILKETDKYKSSEKEGWVINIYYKNNELDRNYSNNHHFRVKVKTDDYVLMHKALTNKISPNALIESFIYGKVDDFISKVPDAYKSMVLGMKFNIEMFLHVKESKIQFWYDEILNNLKERGKDENNRKSFMKTADRITPKKYLGYVKNKYLGKEYNLLVKGNIKSTTLGHIGYNDIIDYLEKESFNDAV